MAWWKGRRLLECSENMLKLLAKNFFHYICRLLNAKDFQRAGRVFFVSPGIYTVKLAWEVTPWKGWTPAVREPSREPAGLPTTDPRWLSRDTDGGRFLKEDCWDNWWEATTGWPVKGWRQDRHGEGPAWRHVPRPENRLQQEPKNMSWTFSVLIFVKEAYKYDFFSFPYSVFCILMLNFNM